MTEITLKRRGTFLRKFTDAAVRVASLAALLLAVGGMAWILTDVIIRGGGALSWSFLTNPSRPPGVPGGGIANAICGTLLITLFSTLIALPPAVLAGIYLAEFGRGGRLGGIIRFAANVAMGVPSVLVGLFVYALVVAPSGHFSGFAGSIALAVIMFPVIVRTTEDMMLMAPNALRESALALGMSRARATLRIVCRAARSGMVTGVLLAVARISGETAPLLFTALWSDSYPKGFFTEPTANLPILITEYATNSPFEEMHRAGWGAALVVCAAVLVLNIVTRIFFREKHR